MDLLTRLLSRFSRLSTVCSDFFFASRADDSSLLSRLERVLREFLMPSVGAFASLNCKIFVCWFSSESILRILFFFHSSKSDKWNNISLKSGIASSIALEGVLALMSATRSLTKTSDS